MMEYKSMEYLKKLFALLLGVIMSMTVFSQTAIKVTGVVTNTENEVISGVSILSKNQQGTATFSNTEGKYEITVDPESGLIFSYVGYKTQEIATGKAAGQVINVVMEPSEEQLEEVTIVGYGTQRKVSVIGAISTVKPKELQSGAVTSVTNALAGRVSGLIGVQSSGEPGDDVSEFWIRGISTFGGGASALVLIDGIDRGAGALSQLAPEDIESFSILKDASATAVYGARGANGVIIINTRRGQEGRISINANVKTMMEYLPRLPAYLGAYDYASLANEARTVRGDRSVYSPEIFDIIKYNMDPDLYPDVNWQDVILKDHTYGAQGNVNISGGGKLARYYMSGFYRTNDAIYNQTGMERYNSNVRRNQYSFRSNIDVDVTKSTQVSLLISATLVDQNRPGIGTTANIWQAQANLTPLLVPIRYSNGQFPSYGSGINTSPIVQLNETGFLTNRDNRIESVVKIEQDLSKWLDGLKVAGLVSFDLFNNHLTSRTKMPDLYHAVDRSWATGELLTERVLTQTPMKFATSSYGTRTAYVEAKAEYNKAIQDIHRLGLLFLYQQRDNQRTDVSDELLSIPKRNQGIAGRLTYSFDDIYFIEGNFGYNGSENFPKGQRFGFFPSIALGYAISNYEFVQSRFPFIDMLKLRYSYGLVGNDQITRNGADVRFPYLTTVNTEARGYAFGDIASQVPGVSEDVLGSSGLVWESAVKQNLGLDLQMWNAFSLTVDAFMDRRDNIFMVRQTLPGMMGINSVVWGNVGRMKSWGMDGTASYSRRIGEFDIEARGNLTVTRDRIVDYDEPPVRYPYLANKGSSNGVTRGLIALGLFKDEADISNSPSQFGTVLPGDIKYQDVNGDGVIDSYDIVPIGNSRIPKVQYGFAGSVSWKGIDFNVFFRGQGKADFFRGGIGYYPFSGGETGNVLSIVNDPRNRWVPMEYAVAHGIDPSLAENPDARFPRLTYGENINNNRPSTFWLADASFLRLKTLEIGYSFPRAWVERIAASSFRISAIGDNLYLWDKVKYSDPEQASSNGAVYPLTRSWSLVLQLSF
ncbi:MAG TPA: TonB-dependent receptor [Parapedobacter sp.]|uniref:SusC/RagA family TonB-linked outer membrane protein n=1 Tax=Parapedobacter sp. TaxID=1958893 RepID=UPI002C2B31FB|nr:TonB-dependent receptor [Parapedobacter sp.]HWK57485.1 TonB-dependent receptor [Parapedobacter sp.]